jgi:hypothetical protein
MAGEGTVKKQSKPGRGRNKGRPRLRWMDDVKLDLMNVGLEMWRTRTVERTESASIMRGGKAKLESL